MTSSNATVLERHYNDMTDDFVLDFQSIPKHVLEDLAAATVKSVKAFLRQPGGKEALDARIAAKKAAQTAK